MPRMRAGPNARPGRARASVMFATTTTSTRGRDRRGRRRRRRRLGRDDDDDEDDGWDSSTEAVAGKRTSGGGWSTTRSNASMRSTTTATTTNATNATTMTACSTARGLAVLDGVAKDAANERAREAEGTTARTTEAVETETTTTTNARRSRRLEARAMEGEDVVMDDVVSTTTTTRESERVRANALPRDVVVEIVARLDSERDLAACAATCSTFRRATRTESVWRNLLAKRLGAESTVVLPKRLVGEVVDGSVIASTRTRATSSRVTDSRAATPRWMGVYKRWHRPESDALRWSTTTTESSLEPAETKYAARYLHRCTAVGDRSKILFFGGQGSGSDFYNDLHLLDLDQPELRLKQLYARSANEPPFPRCSGTLTAMAVNGVKNSEVVALFGGSQGFFEGFSNSLRILCADGNDGLRVSDAAVNGSGLIWRQPVVRANPNNPGHAVPAARWGHSAVALDGKLILFGGSNTTHCFNDTWSMELSVENDKLVATWTLLLDGDKLPAPPARAGQTASLVGTSLYIFGGCHISEVFNDVWKLDLRPASGELRWERIIASGTPPAPRVGHAAVVLGDRIMLCGGRGSAQADSRGKYASDDDGLASMQGLTFFQSGFAMLDTTARRWLPFQYPTMEETDGDMMCCDRITHVREHRTGHVMMPARNGCLLLIGGLGYDGIFQNDLSLVSLF